MTEYQASLARLLSENRTFDSSPYSHQALGHVTPFRDVFMSFFFVSVGMLLDRRDGGLIAAPGADTELRAGDLLFLLGSPAKVSTFARLAGREAPTDARG